MSTPGWASPSRDSAAGGVALRHRARRGRGCGVGEMVLVVPVFARGWRNHSPRLRRYFPFRWSWSESFRPGHSVLASRGAVCPVSAICRGVVGRGDGRAIAAQHARRHAGLIAHGFLEVPVAVPELLVWPVLPWVPVWALPVVLESRTWHLNRSENYPSHFGNCRSRFARCFGCPPVVDVVPPGSQFQPRNPRNRWCLAVPPRRGRRARKTLAIARRDLIFIPGNRPG